MSPETPYDKLISFFAKQMIETTREGVWLFDDSQRITYANSTMAELLGYQVSEMIGRHLFDFLDEEEKEYINKNEERRKRGIREKRLIKKDGSSVFILESISPLFDAEHRLVGTLGMITDISRRKIAEEEKERLLAQIERDRRRKERLAEIFQQEKELLQIIMENTETLLAYLDNDFKFIKINSAFAKWSGLHKQEIIGKNYFEIFPNEENKIIFKRVEETGQAEKYEEKLFIFPRRPKDIIYCDWTLSPVKNFLGNIKGIVISLVDVTKRKIMTEQLAYQASVMRNLSDAVISTDLETNIKTWNKGAEKLYGWRRTEAMGRNMFDLTETTKDKNNQNKIIEQLLKNGTWKGDCVHKNKTNSKLNVSCVISVLNDKKGRPNGFVAINHDITIRQLAQEHLLHEKAKSEALLASLGEGIVAIDRQGIVLFANEAFRQIINTDKKIIGKKIEEILNLKKKDSKLMSIKKSPLWQGLSKKRPTTPSINVFWLNRNDGFKIPVAITSSPIILSKKTIGVIAVFHDITKETEIDRAKTEFVSLASHQLRTPLATISLSSEMLLRGIAGNLSKDQKNYLKTILRNIREMTDLIETLLNISRIEMGTLLIKPELTDLTKLISNLLNELEMQFKNKKLELKKEIHDLRPIKIDKKLMRMIMDNLLSNAIKYTPAGGTISIGLKKQGKDALITVADTGCGIPKKQHSQVFSKLFRADNNLKSETKGSGLGLYIVKAATNQYGGKIWFESEENKATTFYLTIPLKGMKNKEKVQEKLFGLNMA